MRQKNKMKYCHRFGERCKGSDCMIFHEKFEKCSEELIVWNTYALKEAIMELNENLKKLLKK